MRIAYVEDNAINLALVQRIAMMSGHIITSFTEGEIALTELSRQAFDLILMDVELAGEMNGLQVVRTLRARGLTTPIIAVTAYAMLGDREKTLEAGCNEYLPKPLPIGDFIALLARYESKQAAPVVPRTPTAPLVETALLPPTPMQTPAPTAPLVERAQLPSSPTQTPPTVPAHVPTPTAAVPGSVPPVQAPVRLPTEGAAQVPQPSTANKTPTNGDSLSGTSPSAAAKPADPAPVKPSDEPQKLPRVNPDRARPRSP